jgi:UDP-N-acetylmuramoyl-L-alanyl-D-glutamate--2,6-diaminopimelate ligase
MSDGRTLASLLAELPGARLASGSPDTIVTAVEHDSRRVGRGSLFVAVPGFNLDGHRFLAEVAAAGVTAALVQSDRREQWEALAGQLALVEVADTRVAMAAAAAWFHGHPGRELVVIGITGTDGKTTTSHLLTSVL